MVEIFIRQLSRNLLNIQNKSVSFMSVEVSDEGRVQLGFLSAGEGEDVWGTEHGDAKEDPEKTWDSTGGFMNICVYLISAVVCNWTHFDLRETSESVCWLNAITCTVKVIFNSFKLSNSLIEFLWVDFITCEVCSSLEGCIDGCILSFNLRIPVIELLIFDGVVEDGVREQMFLVLPQVWV